MEVTFNIESDFWKDNPQWKYLFAEEYKNKYPSRLMWAILLYAHPDSKFYLLDNVSKADLIAKDYLNKPFNPEDYKDTIQLIKKGTLSPIKRTYTIWNDKFIEREEFIASTPYTAQTYQMLDKILSDTFSMKKQYDAVLQELEREQTSKTHGDVEESASEKGLI